MLLHETREKFVRILLVLLYLALEIFVLAHVNCIIVLCVSMVAVCQLLLNYHLI